MQDKEYWKQTLGQDVLEDNKGHKYTEESLIKGLLNSSVLPYLNNLNNAGEGSNIQMDENLFLNIPFRKNDKYNLERACRWLQANTNNVSSHRCAMFVRMALEAGGLNTSGRPIWAWHYKNYLPKIGFTYVGSYTNNGYTPYPGDIAVYMNGNDKNQPGHICMYTGIQWCSDFRQNNMIVYNNTQKADIFRYT